MPRRTSPRQLDLFLRHLGRTGNITLAAADAGLARSALHKRRARDPAFAQRWDEVLVSSPAFAGEEDHAQHGGGVSSFSVRPERSRGTFPEAPLTKSGDLILLAGRGRRPAQLRRSPAGRLTPAGLAAFLAALEVSANVRLAAAGVGVAASSIYARRRHDHAFAEAMDAALDNGIAAIEAALIEAAALALDPAAFGDEAASPFPQMTVDGALHLLRFHHASRRGAVGRHAVPDSTLNARSRLTDEEVIDQLIPRLKIAARRAAAERDEAAAERDGAGLG